MVCNFWGLDLFSLSKISWRFIQVLFFKSPLFFAAEY